MKVFILIALIAGLSAGAFADNVITTMFSVQPQLDIMLTPENIGAGKVTSVRFITYSNGALVNNTNITLNGAASGRGVTDADGMLVLPVNATSNGSIHVTAEKPGYKNGTSEIMSIAWLDISASSVSITSGINTFVTFSVTSLGKPISEAELNISGPGISFEGITDKKGQLVVQLNPSDAGKVMVTGKRSGFVDGSASVTSTGQQKLSISAGQSVLTVNVPVYVTYTVTADGSAVSDAVVNLSGPAAGSGITNPEGKTVILTNPYATGTITASAGKMGFADGSTTITSVSTQSLNVVASPSAITAKYPEYVMFTVTSGNNFISEVLVTLTGAASGNGVTNQNGQTIILVNSTGVGTITASASKTGFTTGSTTVTATGLQTLSVTASQSNITNGVPAYVTFTVTSGGTAVSGAAVSVSGGGISIDGMTNSIGQVTLQLTASGTGTINVVSRKAGYNDGQMTISH